MTKSLVESRPSKMKAGFLDKSEKKASPKHDDIKPAQALASASAQASQPAPWSVPAPKKVTPSNPWRKERAPDGQFFYHNDVTGMGIWSEPRINELSHLVLQDDLPSDLGTHCAPEDLFKVFGPAFRRYAKW